MTESICTSPLIHDALTEKWLFLELLLHPPHPAFGTRSFVPPCHVHPGPPSRCARCGRRPTPLRPLRPRHRHRRPPCGPPEGPKKERSQSLDVIFCLFGMEVLLVQSIHHELPTAWMDKSTSRPFLPDCSAHVKQTYSMILQTLNMRSLPHKIDQHRCPSSGHVHRRRSKTVEGRSDRLSARVFAGPQRWQSRTPRTGCQPPSESYGPAWLQRLAKGGPCYHDQTRIQKTKYR